MGVEKMSVSFDLELGAAIRTSATASGQSVSGWLADAARDRLRLAALSEALEAWEQRFGELAEDEVAAAERVLDRRAPDRQRGSP